jgi:hypothetical protein
MFIDIKFWLSSLFIKIPLQLSGIIIVPIAAAFSPMGKFPNMFKWFDDYRAREFPQMVQQNVFGQEHRTLFNQYNSTVKGRFVWCAWRNKINWFNHALLGRFIDLDGPVTFIQDRHTLNLWQGDKRILWEYNRTGDNMVPIGKLGYLRVRIGYKISNLEHTLNMQELGIPIEPVLSIGWRRKK